ncbi:Mitochondrial oxaloacetate transport protein [Psilocybe cubensis]|uniref:Mitochondrial oxaloacetate transport protein n=2 Tax=Psilocybe cubensis TaxID=181762 RepID=A0ACB8HAN3_PSICU|nr:Mitochondrial oxaloacetate transport protein [Psilocybe cubensis]KAH9484906.1 Mitochondrial oxaloacetate transport protein [Psilocybe cubensis]
MASSSGPKPLSTPEAFVLGGLAACCAVTVSNPAEVAKTRLQLQGELVKDNSKRVYKNTLDVLVKTTRNEGIRGVQRGLAPAYVYQILVNGARLGFYEPFRQTTNSFIGLSPTEQNTATSVLAGATSGAVGAALGNPLFLIKSRMQAYSPSLPVGTQRQYRNSFHALSSVVREEGLRGLLRGTNAAVLRTAMGSSVQVPSYMWTKRQLVNRGILPAESFWTYLISSSVSGLFVLAIMQPTDTVLTRMYNQPTKTLPNGKIVGSLYRNPIDALWKIAKIEGVLGWYKGTAAHFLRITPHTSVISFSFPRIP